MSTQTATYSQTHPDFYEEIQKTRRADSRNFFVAKATPEAARNFALTIAASFFDDDKIADYGGSTGYGSTAIHDILFCRPTVIDLKETDLEEAAQRGFPTLHARLDEPLPLPDGAFDWGFCSHVLEHVIDLEKTADELTRLTRRGLYLVFPIESEGSFEKNPEHMRYSLTPDLFIEPFTQRGWKEGFRIPPSYDRSDCQVWLYKESTT